MATNQVSNTPAVTTLPVHRGRLNPPQQFFVADDDFTRTVLMTRRWNGYSNSRCYAVARFRAAVNVPLLGQQHEMNVVLILHRVIYTHYHSPIPKGFDIDHIDRNPLNNHPANLRAVSRSANNANSKRRKDNTSGYRGVSWERRKRKWLARIVVSGKYIHLGYYDDRIIAAAAVNRGYELHYPSVQAPNRLAPTAQQAVP